MIDPVEDPILNYMSDELDQHIVCSGRELRARVLDASASEKRERLQQLARAGFIVETQSGDQFVLTVLGLLSCRRGSGHRVYAEKIFEVFRAKERSTPGFGEISWADFAEDHYLATCLAPNGPTYVGRLLNLFGLVEGDTSGATSWSLNEERLEELLEASSLDEAMRLSELIALTAESSENAGPHWGAGTAPGVARDLSRVFIIHGRNIAAKDEMAKFLLACGLKSLEFDEIRCRLGGTPTVDQIVEAGMTEAQGVIALFTPDEEAELRHQFRNPNDTGEALARRQARPNVIFEAGMAFGRDRNRVVFVLLGSPALFTDVAGVHVLRPTNSAKGHRKLLRDTLKNGMGCAVNNSSDWEHSGDFEGCVAPSQDVALVGEEG